MIRYHITTDSLVGALQQAIAFNCESEYTVKAVADERCISNNGCPDCSEILARDETNVSWKDGKANA